MRCLNPLNLALRVGLLMERLSQSAGRRGRDRKLTTFSFPDPSSRSEEKQICELNKAYQKTTITQPW